MNRQRFETSRLAPLMRAIAGPPFTIVSNNCWGAHVYQAMGLEYRTPFVGMFIPPKGYLTLLADFDRLMREPLRFVPRSASDSVNAWRDAHGLTFPIGILGDAVEIDFQHYRDEAEVLAKWPARCERMVADPGRRFFKFDDREGAEASDIEAFCALPLANKVCFTARPHAVSTVVAPAAEGGEHVLDGVGLAQVSRRLFNTLKWLSPAPAWAPVPSLL